jgi:hypothetical protein
MRKQLALSAIILLSGIVNAQEQDYVVSCSNFNFYIFHKIQKNLILNLDTVNKIINWAVIAK